MLATKEIQHGSGNSDHSYSAKYVVIGNRVSNATQPLVGAETLFSSLIFVGLS